MELNYTDRNYQNRFCCSSKDTRNVKDFHRQYYNVITPFPTHTNRDALHKRRNFRVETSFRGEKINNSVRTRYNRSSSFSASQISSHNHSNISTKNDLTLKINQVHIDNFPQRNNRPEKVIQFWKEKNPISIKYKTNASAIKSNANDKILNNQYNINHINKDRLREYYKIPTDENQRLGMNYEYKSEAEKVSSNSFTSPNKSSYNYNQYIVENNSQLIYKKVPISQYLQLSQSQSKMQKFTGRPESNYGREMKNLYHESSPNKFSSTNGYNSSSCSTMSKTKKDTKVSYTNTYEGSPGIKSSRNTETIEDVHVQFVTMIQNSKRLLGMQENANLEGISDNSSSTIIKVEEVEIP